MLGHDLFILKNSAISCNYALYLFRTLRHLEREQLLFKIIRNREPGRILTLTFHQASVRNKILKKYDAITNNLNSTRNMWQYFLQITQSYNKIDCNTLDPYFSKQEVKLIK